MEHRSPRIFVAGRLCVQADQVVVDEAMLSGRQSRLLWAVLVLERFRAVTRDELAEILWPGELPREWQKGLNALVSKLRQCLAPLACHGVTVGGGHGWYQLRSPAGTWIDFEQALLSVDVADAALAGGDLGRAWAEALVAATITRRPFLAGVENGWADDRRTAMRAVLVRALETFAVACDRTGQYALAVSAAAEVTALEPFRESAYRLLMAAHAAAGNRAQALDVYEGCRRTLAEHLGVIPAPETRALHASLLRD